MIAIIVGISWALLIALLSVFAFIALLLLAGFLYQCIGGIIDCRRLRTRGRLVDIGNDRRLYLVEKGPRDRQPTVVFESGFGATSLNWAHIQEALAPHVHTVAYDRCGLGWSSACVSDRTPTHVAAELRKLLHTAGIEPPYLLTGHSFGGLVMQRFALDYPDETAGVILIDPMRTDEWPPVNTTAHARIARAQRLTRVGATCARFGLTRLAARSHLCGSARLSGFLIHLAGSQGEYLGSRLNTEIGKMPANVRPSIAAHWSAPRFYRGLLAHLNAVPATVTEMHNVEPIRDTPVVVLTPAGAAGIDDMRPYGPNSRHIVAENSQHWIHLDEPALVVRTILDFVAIPGQHVRERALSVRS
jgi:pimeloyl-ACP methyl ester carboxylesterase